MLKIVHRAKHRIDVDERHDVVAAVLAARRVDRIEPHGAHAQRLDIVELVGQAAQIARAVRVRVGERAHVHLIDGVSLPPGERRRFVEQALERAPCAQRQVDAHPEGDEEAEKLPFVRDVA